MKDALALALVHFLWQGALLALAGAVLMRVTRVPTVRYAIGVATMIAMRSTDMTLGCACSINISATMSIAAKITGEWAMNDSLINCGKYVL